MTQQLYCSFCGKHQGEVAELIAGPGPQLFICDECVALCTDIIEGKPEEPHVKLVSSRNVEAAGALVEAAAAMPVHPDAAIPEDLRGGDITFFESWVLLPKRQWDALAWRLLFDRSGLPSSVVRRRLP
jgi:hypothetical protein